MLHIEQAISLYCGGAGSGCRGSNCGRKKTLREELFPEYGKQKASIPENTQNNFGQLVKLAKEYNEHQGRYLSQKALKDYVAQHLLEGFQDRREAKTASKESQDRSRYTVHGWEYGPDAIAEALKHTGKK